MTQPEKLEIEDNITGIKKNKKNNKMTKYAVIGTALVFGIVLGAGITTVLSMSDANFQSDTEATTQIPKIGAQVSTAQSICDTNLQNDTEATKHLPKMEENPIEIVKRSEWLAYPPNNPLTEIEQPTPNVVIIHTATRSCESKESCKLMIRSFQIFHMESRGWDDIAYNFIVGGDGNVYEGRGWDYAGAHTKNYNNNTIGIVLVGNFMIESPSQKQIESTQRLIAMGVHLGKLSKDYKLFGHRQLMATQSPGLKLFQNIKQWDRFVEK